MFPNNPLFIEKLVQTKQDDILRELPNPHAYEFQKTDRLTVLLKAKAKIWVLTGVLLGLAWWFSVII